MKPFKKNIHFLTLTIATWLFSSSFLHAQDNLGLDDSTRMAHYQTVLENVALKEEAKADSAFVFAQKEYAKANYQTARDLCETALKFRPKWGRPHVLIGKCYASSGKQCDPNGKGAGWDAQVLLWVAFDEWEKAVSAGDSSADEARSLMGKYASYFPEETTCKRLHSLAEGDEYFVGCWVQRKTKVRLKP